MKLSLIIFYFIIFISGLISLSINRKHLITRLLRLEIMILGLFCSFSYVLIFIYIDIYILLIFLSFRVCEGVIGLSCLIVLIRSHGNDYLLSIRLKTC